MKNLWKEYGNLVEEVRILNLQSWVLQLQSFEYMQTAKAKSKLNALGRQKKWLVGLGILWVVALLFLVVHSLEYRKIFFVVSVGMIALINIIGIIGYIKQVVLIRQIDNSESVTEVQQKIAELQSSTLWIVRWMFLQTPFYCSWFTTPDMALHDVKTWTITLPVFALFTLATIWLYRSINFKNADKKWFKAFFRGAEWGSVIQAKRFMEEIDEFKR